MNNKTPKLSPLGVILENLEIATSTLARHLHVDASLVSKWKSGDRKLAKNSVYFAEIVAFLLSHDNNRTLLSILSENFPNETAKSKEDISAMLTSFLLTCHFYNKQNTKLSKPSCTSEVTVYDKGIGRRQAVSDLLDIAEDMQTPREILFIDSEQFRWLLEDKAYAKAWVNRMYQLLERGFHARVVVHFSSDEDSFSRIFRICGPLFFHKNIKWYRHKFYDDETHWFSFFILENTMSIMGMSMTKDHSYTAVFPDAFSVMHHKNVVESVISAAEPFFEEFPPEKIGELIKRVLSISRLGTILYAYLPVPALISANEEIISNVLTANGVDAKTIRKCLDLCKDFSQLQSKAIEPYMGKYGRVVNIFQLDRMERCTYKVPFSSCSLSLMSGESIIAEQELVAQSFDFLAKSLEENPYYSVALTSEQDFAQLTEMNCWCEKDRWLLQMDRDGCRFCDEPSLAAAATTIFEQAYKRIPSCRKVQEDVLSLIKNLSEEMRKNHENRGS